MAQPLLKKDDIRAKLIQGSRFFARHALDILRTMPDGDAEVWELRARAYYLDKKFEKAAECAILCFQMSGSPYIFGMYGSILLATSRREEGERILEELVARRERKAAHYTTLAFHYMAAERPNDALRVLNAAFEISEFVAKFPKMHVMRSMAYMLLNDYRSAKVECLEAVSLILGRRITRFSDDGECILNALRQVEIHPDWMGSLLSEVSDFISEEVSQVPDLQEFEASMLELQNVFDAHLRDEVLGREDSPESIRISMETFHDLEPLRLSANEALD